MMMLFLAACQGTVATPPPVAISNATAPATPAVTTAPAGPKKGGHLTMTLEYADISSLDPVVPDDNSSIWTILNIYDQLFRVSKDAKSVEPDAVTDYTVSADNLTYTFNLRKDLKFSDGSPVTVDDVIFSLQRMLVSDNWGFLFPENGVTIEAAGDNAFKMVLKQPYAPLINNLAGFWSSIVPKKQVEAQGDSFWEKPIGTGPFMVKEWVKGDHITLSRNPYYWEEGKPYLDEVELRPGSDDNTRVLKFQAKQLDVLLEVPYNQVKTLDSIDGASAGASPLLGALRLYPNLTYKPLSDINVRMALEYATDRQSVVDTVLFGYGEAATTPLIKIPGWWNDNLPGFPYDLQKAKQFIAKSSVPNGFELTATYEAGNTTDEQIAILLQQQWSKIGIDLKLQPLDPSVVSEQFSSGLLQMPTGFWSSSDVIDPAETSSFFGCKRTQARQGFCDQKLNQLYLDSSGMTDPAVRKAAFFEMQQIANDNAYWIPLLYIPSISAQWDYVKDFQVLPTGNFRLWEVWRDKKSGGLF
jgi:peptide/nickel transport system substrate-binding protein